MKEEWYQKVSALARAGKGEEADRMVEEKIRTNPETAQDYFDRGMAYWSQGKLDTALGDFTRCVEIEPDDYEANLRIGWMLANLARHEEAMKVFENVIILRPEEFHGYNGYAQALFSLGRYEEFLKYNEALIERLPRSRGFWVLGRIGALNKLGRHGEALESLNEIGPGGVAPVDSYMYFLFLAETLTLLERFDDALDTLKKGMDETKAAGVEQGEGSEEGGEGEEGEGGCVRCFVGNSWRTPYLEPLRKPPYLERFEEIVGPKSKINRKKD